MGNVFGEQKTMKEIIREQKRMVERSVRGLERDRQSLERDEKKLITDIKKAAKQNQMKSVKIMAKDLVRIRKHQEKFVNLTAQLRAISLQMTALSSTHAITESMKKVTKSMAKLNQKVKLPELQKIMGEFAKQMELMEMREEMMGDAIDDAMEEEGDEKEEELIVNQVLDEIGISLNEGLVDAPGKKIEQPEIKEKKDEEKELEARFNKLDKWEASKTRKSTINEKVAKNSMEERENGEVNSSIEWHDERKQFDTDDTSARWYWY